MTKAGNSQIMRTITLLFERRDTHYTIKDSHGELAKGRSAGTLGTVINLHAILDIAWRYD